MKGASVKELLKLAISIEEEGIKFYTSYANKADKKVKDLFLKLADDEKEHAVYFQKLHDEIEQSEDDAYLFDPEVNSYFSSIANSTAFNKKIDEAGTTKEVIEEAIKTEKLTVDFYNNLYTYSKGESKDILKQLMEEEKRHVQVLEQLLEDM